MKRGHLLAVGLVLIFTSLAFLALLDAWDRQSDIEEQPAVAAETRAA